MGIKNLKKYIKDKHSECVEKVHISHFRDCKIAIDISSYIYKYKAIFGENWLSCFPNLLIFLKKNSIHGVFIFDGKPPAEKNREQKKRKDNRNTIESNVVSLSLELDIYKENGRVSDGLIKVMEKIKNSNGNIEKKYRLLHSKDKVGNSNNVVEHIDVEAVEQYLKKKELQLVSITQDDIKNIKSMIGLFGSNYIQAPGEAESLCCMLCIDEKVSAVLTEDTDVLAYGCPLFISDLNTSSGECTLIKHSDILSSMEFTRDTFLDFCIMCGTDYNDNIPNIGCSKVYSILKKYTCIEDYILSEEKKDKPVDYGILNHSRVREIFNTFGNIEKSTEYRVTYWDSNINLEALYSFLNSNKIKYYPSTIESAWNNNTIEFVE